MTDETVKVGSGCDGVDPVAAASGCIGGHIDVTAGTGKGRCGRPADGPVGRSGKAGGGVLYGAVAVTVGTGAIRRGTGCKGISLRVGGGRCCCDAGPDQVYVLVYMGGAGAGR